MKSIKPKITVIIPAYNHEKFVKQAIMSVVNQTYGFDNIQLLTVDDCSSDSTSKILEELSKKYGFRNVINSVNQGVVKNLNLMLNEAEGKYVALCASDDYWDEQKLENQVSLMESLGDEFGMCHTIASVIDEYDNFVFYQDRGIEFQECIFPKILIDNAIVAPSVLIRKEVFDKVGLFDENILFEDRDMWIRIAQSYKIAFVNEPLVFRRQHINNLGRNKTIFYEVMNRLFDKYYDDYRNNNLINHFHYYMLDCMSAYDLKKSFYHLNKIDFLYLFKKKTPLIFIKLFSPKYFFNGQNGMNIRKLIKKW
jgi:glycosyltransferase involved in cell wall biosynthesis